MELEYESDSEIINSKNNYKFDNYGIVMADSIEDLLYDKYYYMKKRKKNHNNISSNKESSELVKKENESKANNIENDICSNTDKQKENKINDNDNNLNKVKENKKNDNENDNDNNLNNVKEIKINDNNNDNDIDNNLNIVKENKMNDDNDIDNNLNNVKENKMNDNKKNKRNSLKITRCKDFEIKKNKNNDKNKKIKIIFNINNKEKKEIEINPYDTNLIKNVKIKAKNKTLNNKKKYKNLEINRAIEIKDNKQNIEKKDKKNLYYNNIINNKNNKNKDIKKRFSSDKMNLKKDNSQNELIKIDSKGTGFTSNSRNDFKNKYMKENTKNDNNHIIKLNVNLINKNKNKNKKYLIHNIPISSQCYIEKIRKNKNVLFHKAIPKKNRVFITKSYIKKEKDIKNKNKNTNILNIPNSSICYFTKKFRIINVYSHIPLQNVLNNNYFSTKEILSYSTDLINNKKIASKFKKKHKEKEKEKKKEIENENYHSEDDKKIDVNENKEFSRNNRDKKIKIYKKPKINKKREKKYLNHNNDNNDNNDDNNNDNNDDNNNENNDNNNMPNIIIKILNSSYKKNYRKNLIRANSSTINSRNSNLGKSKLLKRINDSNSIFNLRNNNNLYLLPLKIKKVKKLRNIYSHHIRYDSNNKSEPDFHNTKIVSAFNPRYKSNCPACFVLFRNKKLSDEFDRNLQLKSQKISKSEKNMKTKPFGMMEFRSNLKKNFRNNLRNNLILSQNKEELVNNNKIDNLFSQSKTKYINYYRNNNQRKNSIDSNIGFSLFNKNSYFTHIEFPAIDSYFH